MKYPLILSCLIGFAGCTSTSPAKNIVTGPRPLDLSQHIFTAPPPQPAGTCWTHETLPTVYATASQPKARVLRQGKEVHFRTLCSQTLTPELTATIQRALKARGYYRSAVTGKMDGPTQSAILQFQSAHGLDSKTLAWAGAEYMGIVPSSQK